MTTFGLSDGIFAPHDFQDTACDCLDEELAKIADAARDARKHSGRAPLTRKSGVEFGGRNTVWPRIRSRFTTPLARPGLTAKRMAREASKLARVGHRKASRGQRARERSWNRTRGVGPQYSTQVVLDAVCYRSLFMVTPNAPRTCDVRWRIGSNPCCIPADRPAEVDRHVGYREPRATNQVSHDMAEDFQASVKVVARRSPDCRWNGLKPTREK